MKKFIPTLILVIVCIAGFWYASSQSFFQEEEDKSLNSVKAEDITSFSIKSETENIELQRGADGWTITKPQPMPLGNFAVDSWTSAFASITYEDVVEEAPGDLAKFGLEPPKHTFTVSTASGEQKTLYIGDALPVPNYYYGKWEGEPTVYQIPSYEVDSLNKSALDFMDKQIVNWKLDDVQSIELKWKDQSFLVEKVQDNDTSVDKWKMGDKELSVDQSGSLTTKIQFLSTDELVKPAQDVSFDGAELTLTIKEKSGETETTSVYKGKIDQHRIWIAEEGGQFAYVAPVSSIDEIADILEQ